MSPSDARRPVRPVRARFIAGYTVAQIGAFISFMPLLQVLLPLKAAALDPVDKTILLSQVMFCGALVASLANLLAGAVSDRTASRFGRRRPWLLAGAAGTALSYGAIWTADSKASLILALIGFQIAFNLMYAALTALLPDQVPDAQKGRVAAFLSLGNPIGTVVGAVVIGGLILSPGTRYLALAAAPLLMVAPFALWLRDPPLAADSRPPWNLRAFLGGLWVNPRAHPDFAYAWLGRFLVLVAISLVQCYMLYYLQDTVGYERLFPGHTAESGLAVLTAVSTAANVGGALLGGVLSDRLRRRRLFAGGAAVLIAGAIATFALAPSWPIVLAAYVVYGCGSGCYYAVDIALVAQVLPSTRDVGKDLGVINLANTLPQALAPLLALGALGGAPTDYRTLFLIAAGLAAAGALAVAPIKGVR